MKLWLQENDLKMNSPYCEEKSVVAERFLRTLKNKTNEHMTSITKNVCIDKLVWYS